MTNERHLERDLPAILGDIAAGRYPDYIDDVLTTTARRRQRPGWTFPERWLPVELVSTRVPTTRMPWRQLGVLALIALLFAAALAAYVGSRGPQLPAPFGPARNGLLISDQGGDLFVRSGPLDEPRLLLGGQTNDHDAGFSPDGARMIFVRTEGDRDYLMAADADGGNPVRIVPNPMIDTYIAWAPDSRRMAVVNAWGGAPKLSIVNVDGSGAKPVELGDVLPRDLTWRPPDGRQLLVRAVLTPAAAGDGELHLPVDFYLVDVAPDGSTTSHALGLAPHKRFGADWDNSGPAWSLDGQRIYYNVVDAGDATNGGYFRIHQIDADGRNDHALPGPSKADVNEAWPVVSPDGKTILVHRWTWKASSIAARGWLAVMPSDGSEAARDIGPYVMGGEDTGLVKGFSPDGSKVIVRADNTKQIFTIDPIDGLFEKLPWTSAGGLPDWQRLKL